MTSARMTEPSLGRARHPFRRTPASLSAAGSPSDVMGAAPHEEHAEFQAMAAALPPAPEAFGRRQHLDQSQPLAFARQVGDRIERRWRAEVDEERLRL